MDDQEEMPVVREYTVHADGGVFDVETTHPRGEEPLYVTKLVCTCFACPSQWDAMLHDGEELYIRYRWGGLTVSYGVRGRVLLRASRRGDGMDGVMSEETLQKVVFNVLHLPD